MTEFEPRCDVAVPVDLPADVDRAALRRIDTVAYLLDDGIPLPGIGYRIGLDPVVGVLPVAGDTLAAVASLFVVVQAALLGVSRWTLVRMCANVLVDVAVGSIPLVGDAFDAVWKANKRNLELALLDLSTQRERRGSRRTAPTGA